MIEPRWLLLPLLPLLIVLASGARQAGTPRDGQIGSSLFHFVRPDFGTLTGTGEIEYELSIPDRRLPGTLVVELTEPSGKRRVLAPDEVAGRANGRFAAEVPGTYRIEARVWYRYFSIFRVPLDAATEIEVAALEDADECEVLNAVHCALPFPSSRFLESAETNTGVRVAYSRAVMPSFPAPLDPDAFGGGDGFSPGVQILMHFPGDVDPERSGASRLLAETRSYGTRSLDSDSPTLLLDVDAGMQPVLHFVENDVQAAAQGRSDRTILFLRPAMTLTPGHRYVVAMRNLVHADGRAVEAEPVFAALRDRRPTTLAAVEARRARTEETLSLLASAGVARESLVLAFDFVVQSDEDLTREMLAMRDRSFAWLAAQPDDAFTVFPFVEDPADDERVSTEHACTGSGYGTWRIVRGTFPAPLYLDSDPLLEPTRGGRLVDDDGDGLPDAQGTMQANFSVEIPCSALEPGGAPLEPMLVGHGLFINGDFMVEIGRNLDRRLDENDLGRFRRVSGATDWLGLSSFDFSTGGPSFIVNAVLLDADNYGTLPDRLRQGVNNTLVLARMMKQGRFNSHEAFRTPGGVGVFAGPDADLDYFGISLGGIMGLMFAGLSPDLAEVATDVPASNFSIMLERSTAVGLFKTVLELLSDDPIEQLVFFGMAFELWDSAEPTGYLRHVTRDPLPGSGDPKKVLMTVARFDGIVPNEASEITARVLGLPNLHDAAGSTVSGLPGIVDLPGPLGPDDADFSGALIYYDLGMYDLDDPAHAPFVPPLANDNVRSNCDPHGRSFRSAAATLQITRFLDTGVIENTCNGLCDPRLPERDAPDAFELSEGRTEVCDPLTEPPPDFGLPRR